MIEITTDATAESTTEVPVQVRRIKMSDWLAEGESRFGSDRMEWAFVCPICENTQSASDFKPYRDRGASPHDAYFNCLGRFIGGRKAFGDNLRGTPKRPCNYTMGGLLKLVRTIVLQPGEDGGEMETEVFEFAEPAKK